MNAAQNILIFGVRIYRWVISPLKSCILGPFARCRFTPTCSEYTLEALKNHGALGGTWLGLKRICRCHPWGGWGHDPVPEKNLKLTTLNFKTGNPGGRSKISNFKFQVSSFSPSPSSRRR